MKSEFVKQWVNELIIESTSERLNGWMDRCTSELLFFVELLLH